MTRVAVPRLLWIEISFLGDGTRHRSGDHPKPLPWLGGRGAESRCVAIIKSQQEEVCDFIIATKALLWKKSRYSPVRGRCQHHEARGLRFGSPIAAHTNLCYSLAMADLANAHLIYPLARAQLGADHLSHKTSPARIGR